MRFFSYTNTISESVTKKEHPSLVKFGNTIGDKNINKYDWCVCKWEFIFSAPPLNWSEQQQRLFVKLFTMSISMTAFVVVVGIKNTYKEILNWHESLEKQSTTRVNDWCVFFSYFFRFCLIEWFSSAHWQKPILVLKNYATGTFALG